MPQPFHSGLIKRLVLALAFVFFLGFSVNPIPAKAQTTLSAGDIAIIGMNADDPDEFAFVLLTNITSGTVINFTDNGWFSTNSFRSGEGTVTWTASTDMCAGTIVNTAVGTMLFAAAGDQILAYQGTALAPTFIYALNNEGAGVWQADATSSNTSALPMGLTNGTSAFALNEIDNATYTGTISGTKAALLAAIATGANWTTNDTVRQTMPSTNFTVTDAAPCSGDPAPTVSSTNSIPSNNPIITITFDEDVTVTPGSWFTIVCDSVDVTNDFGDTGGPTIYTLTYTGSGLADGAFCTVTLNAAEVTDSAAQNLDGNNDGTGGDDYSFTFTILTLILISDVQGTGSVSPLDGTSVKVQGIVIGDFQAANELSGFFVQEEDVDVDADPNTSEGVFVYCGAGGTCPALTVGDLVTVIGAVDEFNNQTQIDNDNTNLFVVLNSSGNTLPAVTTLNIGTDLVTPAADKDSFYEPYEGMLVSISDTMSIAEYFEHFRFGELVLYQGGRPYQYTHNDFTPTAGEFSAYTTDVARRRIVLDDGSSVQNRPLSIVPQQLYYPSPNGFGTGTQGTDYFRGGDTISGLTGVLGYAFSEWRLQPTQASYTFNAVNTRPTVPVLAGNITVASFNVLNYFDGGGVFPTSRGAHSAAEFALQTNKLVQALAQIDADVFGLIEIQNNTTTIAGLVASLNAVVGAGTYDYINTGVIGTDEIMVAFIYKTTTVAPVAGTTFVDLDPIHNRPPVAQTFEVIDATSPDFGGAFTVVVNHFKSKGSACGAGDDDTTTGQGNCNVTRIAQANRLLTWINGTVIPGSGEDDVLIIGDLNSNRGEDPITVLTGGGYTNLVETYIGPNAYSYVFDGMLGYLDHALANGTMAAQVVGVADWHINADEGVEFDYNDDVLDAGESSFEEEPDGNPLYEVNPYRTSDHDPVLISLDLSENVIPPMAVQVRIAGNITGVIRSNNVRLIEVLFNQALRETGVDDLVTDYDNYFLFHAGANGVLDTPPIASNFCVLGANPVGDDIKITIDGVSYNSTSYNTVLDIENAYQPLALGEYLFVICGSTSIVSSSGIPLDGNGDGIGGDDFSTTFTILAPTGGGTGTATGGGTGTIVDGGIDYNGDGVPDVTQLPNTGEGSIWKNWILWAGALLLLSSFGLLLFGGVKQKQ